MTKNSEPYFVRQFGEKMIYMSLWGNGGKRKWRVGPDPYSKVCWIYTKKRSANYGIPLNGWFQSTTGGWEEIKDIKVSMRD